MTLSEFSNEFDLFYNNIMSNAAPGLTEYEKSVFLTKAQDDIIKAYFNPKGNKFQEGLDDSPKRQIDFSTITVYTELGKATGDDGIEGNHFNVNSVRFKFPDDAIVVINETLKVQRDSKAKYLVVVPISYLEYNRLMSKPYKYPIKGQAWRLLFNNGTKTYTEIIAGPSDDMGTSKYFVRYIKRPSPIILEDLPDGLTINNKSKASDCILDEGIHHEILQRAVELAKAAYTGDLTTQVALGQSSQTNLGIVTSQGR